MGVPFVADVWRTRARHETRGRTSGERGCVVSRRGAPRRGPQRHGRLASRSSPCLHVLRGSERQECVKVANGLQVNFGLWLHSAGMSPIPVELCVGARELTEPRMSPRGSWIGWAESAV